MEYGDKPEDLGIAYFQTKPIFIHIFGSIYVYI